MHCVSHRCHGVVSNVTLQDTPSARAYGREFRLPIRVDTIGPSRRVFRIGPAKGMVEKIAKG